MCDLRADRLNRPRWVAGVALSLFLHGVSPMIARAGGPCASPGGFYPDDSFQLQLAALRIRPAVSWNFTPHDLPPAASVVLNDPLNINTHVLNTNDPWTNGAANTWPSALNNVQFSSNTTPFGLLTPRGMGGLTFSNSGGNLLRATVAADSLRITCELPYARSCQAMTIGLVGPTSVVMRFYFEDGSPITLHQDWSVALAAGQQTFVHFFRSRIVGVDIWNSSGSENVSSIVLYSSTSPPDIAGTNAMVNVDDLLAVINSWGPCPAPPVACLADVAPQPFGNGVVNVDDLLAVLNAWGPAPWGAGVCVGDNPATAVCQVDGACFPLACDHSTCTPSACICEINGVWRCTNFCCGHCS